MSTLKELLDRKASIQTEMETIQQTIEPQLAELRMELLTLEGKIFECVAADAKGCFLAAQKDTGTINFVKDGVLVKSVVDKKVDWNQQKLREIGEKISLSGDDPDLWILTKYTVSENSYKAWPDAIKAIFRPARTVTPGRPKFEFVVDPGKVQAFEEEIPF